MPGVATSSPAGGVSSGQSSANLRVTAGRAGCKGPNERHQSYKGHHRCPRNSWNAIALLKADHRKVEGLFAKFEKAKDKRTKKALATEICTELTVHTIIEEEIFYPACQEAVEEDLRLEAYVEHDGAKVLIAELEGKRPDNAFYDAKVKVLSEQIEHHVKEEEKPGKGPLRPRRARPDLDLDELGARMAARKKELLAAIKTGGLPTPETRSFTGHDIEQGEPVELAA